MPDAQKIPKLTGKSSSALRLSPVDGFVLSRIDGKVSAGELAALTGLGEAQVNASLQKLVAEQVVAFADELPAPERLTTPRPDGPPAGAPPPAAAGNDGAGGEVVLHQAIRTAMEQLPKDTPELADKKVIKRSYFELAALFHPDRYFRKRLGSFKQRMETIFGKVTQAYDTLSSRERRAEYDAYLTDLDRTRKIENLIREAESEALRAEQSVQAAAARSSYTDVTVDEVAPPPAAGDGPGQGAPGARPSDRTSGFYSSIEPKRASAPAPPPSPTVSDKARRDALAMRLLGNRALPRTGGAPPAPAAPAPVPAAARAEAADQLKRRDEARVQRARDAQAEKYLVLGKEAEAKNDPIGAATVYKVALTFMTETDPRRPGVQAAIAKADETLSETYLRQALYEERQERWTEAARSWQKVVRGRPNDARALERAANAMARSKTDLHAAAELAKRAIAADPNNADYKATLAAVYLEAGLALNARRELEAAAQLSPRNATIQALLKRVNKAG